MSMEKAFILAGNAIFTIEEPSGIHHTFRVRLKEASEKYDATFFVSFLSGPDNEGDYTYLGILDDFGGSVRTTRASANLSDSHKLRLLNRVLYRIWRNEQDAFESKGYKVHHEGKCGRCGRTLTVPSSIESGIGPECSRIMAVMS